MNVKDLIKQIQSYNTEIIAYIKKLNSLILTMQESDSISENEVLLYIKGGFDKFGYHPELNKSFADFLQLLNNKELIETFDLEDIEPLIRSNMNSNSDDIQTNIELAHFLFLLGNNDESKQLIEKGLSKIKKGEIDFNNLLKKIHEEESDNFPYKKFADSELWSIVDSAIEDLVINQDLVEMTQRKYIVGYICKLILESDKIKLDKE